MNNLLSTDLDSPNSVPYFLWDAPMTVAELKQKLASASDLERIRLLGKILREARDTEVLEIYDTSGSLAKLGCGFKTPCKATRVLEASL